MPGQTDLCKPTTRRLRWNRISSGLWAESDQATNDKQQLVPTVKAVEEQAGQKPQEVMTDSGYARRRICSIWRRKRSKASLPPTRSLIVTVSSRARGTATAGSDAGGPHATETADQGGSGHLLQA